MWPSWVEIPGHLRSLSGRCTPSVTATQSGSGCLQKLRGTVWEVRRKDQESLSLPLTSLHKSLHLHRLTETWYQADDTVHTHTDYLRPKGTKCIRIKLVGLLCRKRYMPSRWVSLLPEGERKKEMKKWNIQVSDLAAWQHAVTVTNDRRCSSSSSSSSSIRVLLTLPWGWSWTLTGRSWILTWRRLQNVVWDAVIGYFTMCWFIRWTTVSNMITHITIS